MSDWQDTHGEIRNVVEMHDVRVLLLSYILLYRTTATTDGEAYCCTGMG